MCVLLGLGVRMLVELGVHMLVELGVRMLVELCVRNPARASVLVARRPLLVFSRSAYAQAAQNPTQHL